VQQDSMAPMQVFMLMAGLGLAAGMNLVNRESGKCLDLFSPCIDGTSGKNCKRIPAKDLQKGTNLQLYHCNGEMNQEFEFLSNSRLRNPLTNLCIDILAPCKDHFRTPCERVGVTELKGHANIQLYTCHEDSGVLSNSYGNQKWNFEQSMLRNKLSNLCLGPKQKTDKLKADGLDDMANIQAEVCQGKLYQQFDWKESNHSQQQFHTLSDATVPDMLGHNSSHALNTVVSVGGLLVAAVLARAWQARCMFEHAEQSSAEELE
jgi:hypothetical protein